MMNPFKNQIGSTMIPVLLAGAALLGAGVYVTKTLKSQESLQKSSSLRIATSQEAGEISNVLTDWEACRATFAQGAALTNNEVLTKVLAKNGAPAYENGAELQSGTITEMRLVDYNPGAGLRYNQANLRVTLQFKERRAGTQDSFGGQAKSYKIPLYLITMNNVVQTCMSDSSRGIQQAMDKACRDFGGTFEPASGRCLGISGDDGVIEKEVSDYFCSSAGVGCAHPYAGLVCPPRPDVRGTLRNNWAVSEFSPSGVKECVCMPALRCPNPLAYCYHRDLGTDWCNEDCGTGTWDPMDWGPAPSTRCFNVTYTQTTSCGRSRSMTGTRDPSDWTPSRADYCTTETVNQETSCGRTRTVSGTKICTP